MKHGTCLETVETEYEFFSKVLDLFENGLNFGEVLASQGVTPGGSYHVSIPACVITWVSFMCVSP